MNIIDELRQRYANHEYMKQKLEVHIANLPELMKSIENEYTLREEKKKVIGELQETFINDFCKVHPFFYIPKTEIYVDEGTMDIVSEDTIIQLIGTSLERPLIPYKHKMTYSLLKRIRDRTIAHSNMDTFKFKTVLQSLPFDRAYALYFLAIVGDIIMNKNECVYFIDSSYKPFLKRMNEIIYFIL